MNSGDFSIGSKVWPGTSKVIEEMGEFLFDTDAGAKP